MKSISGYGTSNPSFLGKCKWSSWEGLMNWICLLFRRASSHLLHRVILRNCSPVINVDVDKVQQQLRRLKANKATGPDGVHTRTLKSMLTSCAQYFSSIFLCVCLYQKFQSGGKHSLFFQFPPNLGVTNLTPIALMSQVIKCLERVYLGISLAIPISERCESK